MTDIIVEEVKKRGRQKGDVKPKGYIVINPELRIRIEEDCLTWEELLNKENDLWGNNRYFTSWAGVIDKLIKRFATEKLSKKESITFIDARKEWLGAVNDVKRVLIGEIEDSVKDATEEIKKNIKKFVR